MIIFISLLFLVNQLGCTPINFYPPLYEDSRAKLGNIGIVSAEFSPNSNLLGLIKGRAIGASKGFAAGTIVGATGAAIEVLPYYLSYGAIAGPASLILIATGAAMGGLYGLIFGTEMAIPEEKAKEIEYELTKALSKLKAQETMQNKFLQFAIEQTRYKFKIIDNPKPTTFEQNVIYSSLKNQEIDSVIEISVLSIDFECKGAEDPSLSLIINVRTKLIRLADNHLLYENQFKYRSAERKLSIWLHNNAETFLKEMESAYQSLAEKMVEEIFLIYAMN